MRLRVWIRCLLICLVAAAVVPILTMTTIVPAEDEEVPDLRAVDRDRASNLSAEQFEEHVESIPMRRLRGLERFTYLFTDPYWLVAYWKAMILWFISFFVATALVSFLNARDPDA